jgi:hypothetical protein
MFSKILVKLIDQSLVPAILLVCLRISSLVFFSYLFNFPFLITMEGFVFNSEEQFALLNSYSVLTIILVFFVVLMFIVLKSFILHDSHINPTLTYKILKMDLDNLVQNSYDLYSKGVVWLMYAYLITFVAIIMTVTGYLFSWIAILSGILTLLASVFLLLDIENEYVLHSHFKNKDDSEFENYTLKMEL